MGLKSLLLRPFRRLSQLDNRSSEAAGKDLAATEKRSGGAIHLAEPEHLIPYFYDPLQDKNVDFLRKNMGMSFLSLRRRRLRRDERCEETNAQDTGLERFYSTANESPDEGEGEVSPVTDSVLVLENMKEI